MLRRLAAPLLLLVVLAPAARAEDLPDPGTPPTPQELLDMVGSVCVYPPNLSGCHVAPPCRGLDELEPACTIVLDLLGDVDDRHDEFRDAVAACVLSPEPPPACTVSLSLCDDGAGAELACELVLWALDDVDARYEWVRGVPERPIRPSDLLHPLILPE